MPSNVLSTDTMFPELTENKDVKEYLEEVSDYLFMLKEQLGYSLHNLGMANFNTAQLAKMTKIIREPLYAQIQDTDDNVASLQLTAAGLISRMDNFGGASSTIEQTVGGISTSVSNISSEVDALDDTVGNIAGNYVSKTTATQTSSGFKLDVRSGTNAVMTTLDKDGLTIRNGAIKIKNNYGTDVLYADEYGNLFLTGTISGANIYGSMFTTATASMPTTGDYIMMQGNLLTSYRNGQKHGGEFYVGGASQINLYHNGDRKIEMSSSDALTSYIYGYNYLQITARTSLSLRSANNQHIIDITNNGIFFFGNVSLPT